MPAKKTAPKKTRKAAPNKPRKAAPKKATSGMMKGKKPLPPLKKGEVRLLSGGNPQIPKGMGDAPVQAYIKALPGWKSAAWKRIDALIVKTVPGVQKAVKWNSPLYGMNGTHWFLGVHAFDSYLKLTFFEGSDLTPLPPGTSKMPKVRYLDLYEDDVLDEKQLASWIDQASALPGEKM